MYIAKGCNTEICIIVLILNEVATTSVEADLKIQKTGNFGETHVCLRWL